MRDYQLPIENALATIIGDAPFAKSFFAQYIYDSQLPNLQSLLKEFGINLQLVVGQK